MKNPAPSLELSTKSVIPLGLNAISLKKPVLKFSVLAFLLILAGAIGGFLLSQEDLKLKLLGAGLLFIGFIFGVSALLWIRRAELNQISWCLKILAKERGESRVYFDDWQDALGEVGWWLNQLLEKLREQLEKQLRLISGISHDLRTPLTILKGDMEVALMRPRTPEEYQEILRSNLEEVDRINRLVEDLITVSRAEAGELKMSFKPLDLKKLLAQLIEDFEIKAQEKDITLTFQAIDEIIIINADEQRIRQVLENIILNAIQYSKNGKKIDVILRGDEKEAWVEVKDQGIGIPPKDLPYIFEPFFRSANAKEMVKKSYGLGLSICKQIIDAHNGKIEVESRIGPDSGTTFRIMLPKLIF